MQQRDTDKKFILGENERFLKEYELPTFGFLQETAVTFTDKRLVLQTQRPNFFSRREILISDVAGISGGLGTGWFNAHTGSALKWGFGLLIFGLLLLIAGVILILINVLPPWNLVFAVVGGVFTAGGILLTRKVRRKVALLGINTRSAFAPAFKVGAPAAPENESDFFTRHLEQIVFRPDENTLKLLNEIGAMIINIQSGKPIDELFK
jgi:hypothetical protein